MTFFTKSGSSAAYCYFFQNTTAAYTFFSCSPVNSEAVLERTGIALRIAVIPYGTAALPDGEAEYVLQGVKELPLLFSAQPVRRRSRMYAGPEQRLVRIDIADAGDHGLIEEHGLHLAPPVQTADELVSAHFKRLWAEFLPEGPRFKDPVSAHKHASEGADVIKAHEFRARPLRRPGKAKKAAFERMVP